MICINSNSDGLLKPSNTFAHPIPHPKRRPMAAPQTQPYESICILVIIFFFLMGPVSASNI